MGRRFCLAGEDTAATREPDHSPDGEDQPWWQKSFRSSCRTSIPGRRSRSARPVWRSPARGRKSSPAPIASLTFGGEAKAAIAPGTSLISDPVDLPLDALSRLSVSVYLPQETPLATFHWDGKQTAISATATRRLRTHSRPHRPPTHASCSAKSWSTRRQMTALSSLSAIRSPTAPAPLWMPTTAGPTSWPLASPRNRWLCSTPAYPAPGCWTTPWA